MTGHGRAGSTGLGCGARWQGKHNDEGVEGVSTGERGLVMGEWNKHVGVGTEMVARERA